VAGHVVVMAVHARACLLIVILLKIITVILHAVAIMLLGGILVLSQVICMESVLACASSMGSVFTVWVMMTALQVMSFVNTCVTPIILMTLAVPPLAGQRIRVMFAIMVIVLNARKMMIADYLEVALACKMQETCAETFFQTMTLW